MGDSIPPVANLAASASAALMASARQAQVTGGASNYAAQANIQSRDQAERATRAGPAFKRPRLAPSAIAALDPSASAGATHHDEDEHAGGQGKKREQKRKPKPPRLPFELDETD